MRWRSRLGAGTLLRKLLEVHDDYDEEPLLTPGARNYWKSHNLTQLSDDAVDTLIRYAGTLDAGGRRADFGGVWREL